MIRRKALISEEEFEFWKEKKGEEAKSVEYGGCSNKSYCRFLNFPIAKTLLWAGAFS
jgi:hypothetical protein